MLQCLSALLMPTQAWACHPDSSSCIWQSTTVKSKNRRGIGAYSTLFGSGRSSDALMTLSASSSMAKGPAFILTRMRYSSAKLDGTRHEYPQVKPQPYSNEPLSTTSPLRIGERELGLCRPVAFDFEIRACFAGRADQR